MRVTDIEQFETVTTSDGAYRRDSSGYWRYLDWTGSPMSDYFLGDAEMQALEAAYQEYKAKQD